MSDMREALEWYGEKAAAAAKAMQVTHNTNVMESLLVEMSLDGGQRARAALSAPAAGPVGYRWRWKTSNEIICEPLYAAPPAHPSIQRIKDVLRPFAAAADGRDHWNRNELNDARAARDLLRELDAAPVTTPAPTPEQRERWIEAAARAAHACASEAWSWELSSDETKERYRAKTRAAIDAYERAKGGGK